LCQLFDQPITLVFCAVDGEADEHERLIDLIAPSGFALLLCTQSSRNEWRTSIRGVPSTSARLIDAIVFLYASCVICVEAGSFFDSHGAKHLVSSRWIKRARLVACAAQAAHFASTAEMLEGPE
jgi:hypothetical protein